MNTGPDTVVNIIWVLSCGFLIVLMQAGFTCLESGMVRAKNSINVAIKNLIDFCLAGFIFYVVGFGIMFGESHWGLFGSLGLHPSADDSPRLLAFCFFQLLFCGTATTLVSGAVAERMRFGGYCLSAVILSTFIYPVTGHWVWGRTLDGNPTGWLGQLGFVDFAGASVVHMVGGAMALAALLVIGPRVGRFGSEGRPIEGHNLPTATLGVFLLWVGWFGFNGGSTFAVSERIPLIIANTALGGIAGGLAGLLAAWIWLRKPVVDRIINGVIAGLVSITASAHVLHPLDALIVGAIGSGISVSVMALLVRLEIDDAIGVVPVHFAAGFWGVVAVAIFVSPHVLGTGLDAWSQLQIQLIGAFCVGTFAFVVAYFGLRVLNHWLPLRVSTESERIGLNVSEHGATNALLDLVDQMDSQSAREDFSQLVSVEPGSEVATIAGFYNRVLTKFQNLSNKDRLTVERLNELVNYDPLTGIFNRRAAFECLEKALTRSRRTGRPGGVLYMDLDRFKPVNDTYGHDAGDIVLIEVARRLGQSLRESDTVARLGGDEFICILEQVDELCDLEPPARALLRNINKPIDLPNGRQVTLSVSAGGTLFGSGPNEEIQDIVRRADQAMYEAKLTQRGSFKLLSV